MRNKKLHLTIVQTIAYIVVSVAIGMLMYVCYLLLVPTKVIETYSPMKVSPAQITAGDAITVSFKYCKYRNLDSKIVIDYIGNAVIPSLSTQRHFPTGCHEKGLIITVPTSAPSGEYTLHGTITYKVNSLREVDYEFETVPIYVTERRRED